MTETIDDTSIGELLAEIRTPDHGIGIAQYLVHHIPWSLATFGPGDRWQGICKHIEKELAEIDYAPQSMEEYVDVAILAMDGAWRSLAALNTATEPATADVANMAVMIENSAVDLLIAAAIGAGSVIGLAEFVNEIISDMRTNANDNDEYDRGDAFVAICADAIIHAPSFSHIDFIDALFAKLRVNMARKWPDWRTRPLDAPIEHHR